MLLLLVLFQCDERLQKLSCFLNMFGPTIHTKQINIKQQDLYDSNLNIRYNNRSRSDKPWTNYSGHRVIERGKFMSKVIWKLALTMLAPGG